MSPRPGTKAAQIIELFDAGERNYQTIAEKVGSTYNGVAVALSQHGRTNWRGRRKKGNKPIRMSIDVPSGVTEEAKKRGTSVAALVRELLYAIDEGKIYGAVLEEA